MKARSESIICNSYPSAESLCMPLFEREKVGSIDSYHFPSVAPFVACGGTKSPLARAKVGNITNSIGGLFPTYLFSEVKRGSPRDAPLPVRSLLGFCTAAVSVHGAVSHSGFGKNTKNPQSRRAGSSRHLLLVRALRTSRANPAAVLD